MTACDSGEIFVREDDPRSGYSAVFEDDGRVAYAYLLEDEEIVADVWLYNRCATPSEPEWRDPSRMPFANPQGFASEDEIEPAGAESDVRFKWRRAEAGVVVALDILLRGDICGRLKPGGKPGQARMAVKDGPLAKVLTDDNEL